MPLSPFPSATCALTLRSSTLNRGQRARLIACARQLLSFLPAVHLLPPLLSVDWMFPLAFLLSPLVAFRAA